MYVLVLGRPSLILYKCCATLNCGGWPIQKQAVKIEISKIFNVDFRILQKTICYRIIIV